jgi:hypothetical protein
MQLLRSRPARLAAISLGLATTAVPALAQTAAAADQSCRFVFTSLRAVDIGEELAGGNGDEMYVMLDDVRKPQTFVRFATDGVTRNASAFQNPIADYTDSDPLTVRLFEDDPVDDDRIDRVKSLECTGEQTGQVLVFTGGFEQYRLTYDVDLLS